MYLRKVEKIKIDCKMIEDAAAAFAGIIERTPLEYNDRLSALYDCEVFLKREDRQKVRSYKVRGAFYLMSCLSAAERARGVVCSSAGNHAQGFAFSCAYFKCKGVVFMPRITPKQKITRTEQFGGDFVEVRLVGDTYDEAYAVAKKFCASEGKMFVHPFDDERTIVGQGTVGYEILEQCSGSIDYVIVPIGGGGLCSGLGIYFKEKSFATKIVGVEPEGAAAMQKSFEAGEVVTLEKLATFVDGAAVRRVGEHCFAYVKKVVDSLISVPENRVCSSLLAFLREEGIVLEPAGVLCVDALKDMREEIKGKRVVCVISGGNFDFDRLAEVKERSLRFEGLKKYFLIEFAQRSGALREFLELLGPEDDIDRFEYLKKTSKERGAALVGISTRDPSSFVDLLKRFDEAEVKYEDITENELYFDLLI